MAAMKLIQSAGIAVMFVVGIFTDNLQTKVNVLVGGLSLAAIALGFIILWWVPMTPGVLSDDEVPTEPQRTKVTEDLKEALISSDDFTESV